MKIYLVIEGEDYGYSEVVAAKKIKSDAEHFVDEQILKSGRSYKKKSDTEWRKQYLVDWDKIRNEYMDDLEYFKIQEIDLE